MRIFTWLILCCTLAVAIHRAHGAEGPLTAEAAAKTFELADQALTIDLAASEPEVQSPVAMAWDADGKLYVAEMIGYPVSKGEGRIRRLEDRDGDGRYEHATVFADRLNFPTSVLPHRDGILVTAAPDILFLADSDGDGVADVRRVEWTGFGTGSQQLRANALKRGLDNWIYGANGRCGGIVHRPDNPASLGVDIHGRDFRFDPEMKTIEAIVGQSQFGQAHNDWGDRFLNWNIRHLPAQALRCFRSVPHLLSSTASRLTTTTPFVALPSTAMQPLVKTIVTMPLSVSRSAI